MSQQVRMSPVLGVTGLRVLDEPNVSPDCGVARTVPVVWRERAVATAALAAFVAMFLGFALVVNYLAIGG
jgi:hypothetical protein